MSKFFFRHAGTSIGGARSDAIEADAKRSRPVRSAARATALPPAHKLWSFGLSAEPADRSAGATHFQ